MQTDADGAQVVSLFPFLSILSCVIGVLVLIVTVMSISHLADEPEVPDEMRMGMTYMDLEYEIDSMLAEQAAVAALISEAEAIGRRIQELRSELENLQASSDTLTDSEAEVVREIESADQMRQQIVRLRVRYDELEALIDSKRTRVADSLPDDTVRIIGSTGLNERAFGLESRSIDEPIFVEASSDGLIVHPDGTRIARVAIENGKAFADVLEQVKSTEGGILIFLIREDGVKVFDEAHNVVQEEDVRYGFLPIPGSGNVDLSQFAG